MGKIKNYIIRLVLRSPAKNTLVGDTASQRFNEYLCRVNGCVMVGSYYGIDQATCRRCGHKNHCAGEHVKTWNIPD